MPAAARPRFPLAIFAFALCSFAIGTTEFVIIGLLPEVSDGLQISIPMAGHLVSAYALGVVVGAPLMIALGVRLPRRALLLALMVLFVAGNIASALAPSFGWLFAARVITALPHGAVFGLSVVVASQLVEPSRRAAAISLTFLGLTLASCVGAPLSTLVGQQLGWRAAFVVVAGLGLLGLAALARTVPHLPPARGVTVKHEIRVLAQPRILLSLAIAVVGFAGVFAAVGYVAPILENVAGFSEASAIWGLSVFGLGLTTGNLLSARLQRRIRTQRDSAVLMTQVLVVLGIVLAAFVATAHVPILAVLNVYAIGAVGFTAVPILQAQLLDMAAAAPTMASATVHSAFNLGNALGPFAGGIAIGAGLGDASAAGAGAVLTAAGVVIAVAAVRLASRPGGGAVPQPA
ncbi:MFS transporter [Conexibacter sp. CPCC 206217]|uniref:MFS transporter n=1 Tax=Conexibacter sp. CPCC 206217 TaxID=3064574 RepID=UPI0027205C7E|nr:MFS transporter [Conexibacter sp. CPCC 206217]MDO8209015.1 MFS transporter [Conexibacter sp. CPCC 206217]